MERFLLFIEVLITSYRNVYADSASTQVRFSKSLLVTIAFAIGCCLITIYYHNSYCEKAVKEREIIKVKLMSDIISTSSLTVVCILFALFLASGCTSVTRLFGEMFPMVVLSIGTCCIPASFCLSYREFVKATFAGFFESIKKVAIGTIICAIALIVIK